MEPLAPAPPELPQTQSAARGGAGPADAHARWRYELERAQWKLRSDARPGQSTAASTSAGEELPQRPAAARPAPAVAQDTRNTQRESVLPEKDSFRNLPQADAQRRALRSGARNGPSATGGTQERRPEEGLSRPAQPQATASRSPQQTAWPNVNAHALVEEGQVKAWIRDASLGEAERKRLLRELRARLRAAGLQLETLTVNGREEFT